MINVALFGFGRIGQMHGENLFNHPRFKLKYVYDKNIKLANQLLKVKRKAKQEADQQREMQMQQMQSQQQMQMQQMKAQMDAQKIQMEMEKTKIIIIYGW